MGRSLQVLVDSDAFVGRFYTADAHHDNAKSIFKALEKKRTGIVTTSLVVLETATVLSIRSGQKVACRFLEVIEKSKLPVIHIDRGLQGETLQLFCRQKKKGSSGVDCANAAVMRRLQIPYIFSFDHFYRKQLKLKTVNSPDSLP